MIVIVFTSILPVFTPKLSHPNFLTVEVSAFKIKSPSTVPPINGKYK